MSPTDPYLGLTLLLSLYSAAWLLWSNLAFRIGGQAACVMKVWSKRAEARVMKNVILVWLIFCWQMNFCFWAIYRFYSFFFSLSQMMEIWIMKATNNNFKINWKFEQFLREIMITRLIEIALISSGPCVLFSQQTSVPRQSVTVFRFSSEMSRNKIYTIKARNLLRFFTVQDQSKSQLKYLWKILEHADCWTKAV